MQITKESLRTLWYENDKGDIWLKVFEPNGEICDNIPDGYVYQHSRFPCQVTDTISKKVVPSEVEACDHPEEHVHPTNGWIDGIEGRECKLCRGEQTRNITEPWPKKWEAHGSRKIMSGNSGFCEDLVLAIAERKTFWGRRKYTLGEAILIASQCCERCMNALAYEYGLSWGYKEYSWQWIECNTSCEFCEHEKPRNYNILQKFLRWRHWWWWKLTVGKKLKSHQIIPKGPVTTRSNPLNNSLEKQCVCAGR